MVRAARVLVVDDSPGDLTLIQAALREAGMSTVPARSVAEARRRLEDGPPDLVVTDWRLRGEDGSDVLDLASQVCPGVPVVVLTGAAAPRDFQHARGLGAAMVLPKPMELEGYLDAAHVLVDLLRDRGFRPTA